MGGRVLGYGVPTRTPAREPAPPSEEGEAYALYTISGVEREAFSRFPMPRNTPVFGPTFHGQGAVRSDDITKDPRYGQMAPYHGMPEGHLPVTSYLAVPVVSRTGEVFFTPASSGYGQSDGRKAAERFLERYNASGSLRPGDYADVTRNASYYIGMLIAGRP